MSSTRKAWRPLTAFIGACVAIAACSSILDVENPNNVPEDALDDPSSAAAQAAGVLAATVRALSAITTPYSVATDELDWIGSRDAWRELETGTVSNHFNEFSDQAFPYIAEARFLGDQAIRNLIKFNTDPDPRYAANRPPLFHLARAYLYTAIVYASIADMYDRFAFSSKADARLPLDRAQMSRMYDTAIVYLDRANAIATAPANTAAEYVALRYPIMAYRARAKHGKAVWASITPKLAAGANRTVTLINDAGANADANAAIALGTADQTFTLVNNIEATAPINIWFEVLGRNEHRTGNDYRTLIDPVTGALDVRAQTLLSQFATSGGPPPAPAGAPSRAGTFTITSTREMRLILAEAALAQGLNAEVQNQINQIRALDAGRTAWNGATPDALTMLQHERRVQLWLMRRRLADMHRFNTKDSRWAPGAGGFESAFNVNGLLFPLPQVERLGNACAGETPPAGCTL